MTTSDRPDPLDDPCLKPYPEELLAKLPPDLAERLRASDRQFQALLNLARVQGYTADVMRRQQDRLG